MPGTSLPLASTKPSTAPGSGSSPSAKRLLGTRWTLSGRGWPKPSTGSMGKRSRSPAFRPSRRRSKPGSRLPSPMTSWAGSSSKVFSSSATSPSPSGSTSARRRLKCSVTRLSGPIRSLLMGGLLDGGPAAGPGVAPPVQQQQDHATGDGAVGHIEGGEIVPLPVQADEVDDLAEAQTIPEVAQGAAQQQGQATAQQPLAGAQSPQPGNQQQADAQRHRRQQPALPAPGIGEEAEGCSGIVLQHQVENRHHRQGAARLKPQLSQVLGPLVQDHHHQGQGQPAPEEPPLPPWLRHGGAARRGR